jgi:hypothetical protein
MEIVSHWKGAKIICNSCETQFVVDAEDIKNGALCTQSDAMLRGLKNGVISVLYVNCPHCGNRVHISNEIPHFYRIQAKVVP